MKILLFGVNGLIGSTLFRYFYTNTSHQVFGTCRDPIIVDKFFYKLRHNIFSNIDVSDLDSISKLIKFKSPDIVINCAGITKHLMGPEECSKVLYVNSIFPLFLERTCSLSKSKLLHISSDCVYSGNSGNYKESDMPDAKDIYGISKYLGEPKSDSLVIRISTIGHELHTSHGLLNWFLSQKNSCEGYSKAIFSGIPTIYLAKIIDKFILSRPDLNGLYHISSSPIDKYTLLNMLADLYQKNIKIIANNNFNINRSLNSNKFSNITNFKCDDWPTMLQMMKEDYLENSNV